MRFKFGKLCFGIDLFPGFVILATGDQILDSINLLSTVIMIRIIHIVGEILRILLVGKGNSNCITSICRCTEDESG